MEGSYTLSIIKNKTHQITDEPSCRVSSHLAQWGRLATIDMYAASAHHRWVEGFLD